MADSNPSVEANPPVVASADAIAEVAGADNPAAPSPLPAALAAVAAAEGTALSSGAGTPGPGTAGTMTPMLDPEQIEHSLKVSLADLTAKATALYAQKNYNDASDLFAKAAEMQAEINGEMHPDNAEILFLYGRALLNLGLVQSDIFGAKGPDSNKTKPAAKPKKAKEEAKPAAEPKPEEPTPAERVTEEGIAIVAAEAGSEKKKDSAAEAKKPLFQFLGDDENWGGSDEEEEDGEDEGGERPGEEDVDDLAAAFESLDIARVLFNKKLEAFEAGSAEAKGKEKDDGDSAALRHIKERLAETHELLADICLENERFHDAVPDFRKALALKKEFFPPESDFIAEAHFKLSLALEFASIVATDEEKVKGVQGIDQTLRDEAVTELELAIESVKLKLQNKEVELATNHSPEDNDLTRQQIVEIKETLADMEQRLTELRGLPMDVNAMLNQDNKLGGILGAALGETPQQTADRVEEAKKNANDLTGLVRKKQHAPKPDVAATDAPTDTTNGASAVSSSNGKRKLDETEPEAQTPEADSKKARVEEPVAAAEAEA